MDFGVHVWSLELLAEVAYVKTIWEKPEIKAKFIQTCESQVCGLPFDKGEFRAVNGVVIEKIYDEILPESVKVNVVHVAKKIGENIYNWINYLSKTLEWKISSLQPIEWTSIGTIDLIKMFQNWFSKQENVIKNPGAVISMACRCAQVQFIQNYHLEIQKFIKNFHADCSEDEMKYLTFIRNSLAYHKSRNPNRKPKPSEMFSSAVDLGYFDAVKFYWDEMDIIDQQENVIHYALLCFEMCNSLIRNINMQPLQEYREILMFLISKMSDNVKRIFYITQKTKIVNLILEIWPVQKLFGLFFEEVKNTFTEKQYFSVLLKILKCLEMDLYWDKKLDPSNNFYYHIFQSVWQSFSNSLQEELVVPNPHFIDPESNFGYVSNLPVVQNEGIFLHQHLYNEHNEPPQPLTIINILEQLLKMFHLQGLKLVLKDKKLKNGKNVLINHMSCFFEDIVENENFEALNQFMLEIFDSDEEKKNFKLNLNFYLKFIIKGKFDVVDKLLNWQFDSEKNKKELIIKQIDPYRICGCFLDRNYYDRAENFLNWVFKTEDEKENFKNYFSRDIFVKDTVHGFWTSYGFFNLEKNHDGIEKKSEDTLKFLRWAFTNENKVNKYRKERLITSYKSVEDFIVISKGSSDNFLQFLNFCEISEEKIKEIKKDLFKNIIEVAKGAVRRDVSFEFSDLDFLFTWSADSEEDKKMAVKKFINVVGIAKVWNSMYFRRDDKENCDDRIKFFNEWVKGSPEFIFEVRNQLFWNNRSQKFCPVINYICGKLEKGEDVEYKDLFVISYYESPLNFRISLLCR